ncbi:MAG: hypothetical protein N3B11_03550 [Coriobacteriia bacterium]|nr:hypothetical protein [Coriobacteriia bacterium]
MSAVMPGVRQTGAAVLVVAMLLAAMGCAPTPPRSAADFEGVVVLSTSPGSGGGGAVLVESTRAGKASVNVTADTKVLARRGDRYEQAAFADIVPGQTLDVWTTGQVAESYPVQVWATVVVIRSAR